ncbi:hypothetical protein RS030_3436 [Cryptosporidium xiaoi]|uniref:Uncharacterized protein n=1 Tax=Cryptosporidium xiaoi TaxID=659607 RepID=A0AAV9XXQ1_9CRYT
MNLMELALKNGIKNTPSGPFMYPYSIRGRKPLSLLSDDEDSDSDNLNSPDHSENEEQTINKGGTRLVNDYYFSNKTSNNTKLDDNSKIEQKERLQEKMYEYKSRKKGNEVEYISREDAFEIQYAKDFEFFFGVPYKPYIRMSKYRFGKNIKYPRDLKQENAVYRKYPRYIFNDPWPEIDVSKPIPYVKQKQPPKLVNDRGIPISWINIIERNKRYNIRRGNSTSNDILDNIGERETQHTTLGDAVVALEVSSALLNGDLPSIIGEDKRSRKQKRFSFVRDNIRGVAEEIESWTKCPVIQTDISKYLESSWKNIDKLIDNNKSTDVVGHNVNTENIIRLKSNSSNFVKNESKQKLYNGEDTTTNNSGESDNTGKSEVVLKSEQEITDTSKSMEATTLKSFSSPPLQKVGDTSRSKNDELPPKKSYSKELDAFKPQEKDTSSAPVKSKLPTKLPPSKGPSATFSPPPPLAKKGASSGTAKESYSEELLTSSEKKTSVGSIKSELPPKGPPKGPPKRNPPSKGSIPKKAVIPSKKGS